MQEESLNKALDAIIPTLELTEMDSTDKLELMLNLRAFLKYKSYERNISVLQKLDYEERQEERLGKGRK